MTTKTDKTTRFPGTLLKFLCLLAAGFVYYLIFRITGHGIPCVFHLVTGLKCPGCGMTHAVAALIEGHFRQAMSYNLLSVTLVPELTIYLIWKYFQERRKKVRKDIRKESSSAQGTPDLAAGDPAISNLMTGGSAIIDSATSEPVFTVWEVVFLCAALLYAIGYGIVRNRGVLISIFF